MKKFLVAYGFMQAPLTEERIQHMAKFDLLDTGSPIGADMSRVKALNPNAILLFYRYVQGINPADPLYAEATQHEDWFLHDLNGNRLVNKWYGFEAIDVRAAGWRELIANWINEQLSLHPSWNGVFFDGPIDWIDYLDTTWTCDPSLVPQDHKPEWRSANNAFLTYIRTHTNALMICNPNVALPEFIEPCHGFMFEGWIHAPWYPVDEYYDDYVNPVERVGDADYWIRRGKVIMLYTGCESEDVSPDLTAKLQLYCLASALLVTKDNAYFGWNNIWATSKGYFPEMDVDIGNPRGHYYQVEPLLLGRDFDKARVFVNFSPTETRTVTVDEIPYTLPPHSGVIAPWDAPPIPPIDLPTAAAIGLGLADAALIGIYLATVFGLI